MPQSPLKLIEWYDEHCPKDQIKDVPHRLRGIYVLYQQGSNKKDQYDVVYIGMATTGGIHGRLVHHRKEKGEMWSHFAVFKVWDNIRDDEVTELEGLIRHIYRKDPQANRINTQKKFGKLRKLKKKLASLA